MDVLRFDGGQQELEDRDLPEGSHWYRWIGQQTRLTEANRSEFITGLEAIIHSVKPDLIQAGPLHDVASIVMSTSTAVPVLAMSWGSDLLLHGERSSLNRERITNVLERSSRLLVDCQTLADKAIGLGSDPKEISVIPWGIALEAFPFREQASSWPTVKIISLRSLEPLYDVETLIRALPELRRLSPKTEIEVVIAGDGSLRENLRILAKELGVSSMISWRGRVNESEVQALLESADIYVSTSPIDGTSISLLQAMAVGLPCVVTDIASNHEWVIEGDNGLFFGAGNSTMLARLTLDIASQEGIKPEGCRLARKRIEESASWNQNSTRYLDLLEAVFRNAHGW